MSPGHIFSQRQCEEQNVWSDRTRFKSRPRTATCSLCRSETCIQAILDGCFETSGMLAETAVAKDKMKLCSMMAWAVALLAFPAMNPLGFVVAQSLNDSFYFLVMCDPQVGWNRNGYNSEALFKDAVEVANKLRNPKRPDFVVICGDLIQNRGSDSEFQTFKNTANKLEVPYFPLAGNHDVGNTPTLSTLSTYTKRTGRPLWYTHEHNNNLLIFLESNVLKVRDSLNENTGIPDQARKQMAWLSETLKSAQSKYNTIIVFGHHSVAFQNANDEKKIIPQPARNELLELFHRYDVTAYFSGHFHYNDYVIDGKMEFITYSATGVQLKNDEPGFGIVKIQPGEKIFQQYYTFNDVPSRVELSPATTVTVPTTQQCIDKAGKFANQVGNKRTCKWLRRSSGRIDRNCGKTNLGQACRHTCRDYYAGCH
uniref:Calcineurin-like phosphoesterase domain-containing protein n=1 Tax=Helicotheca tamesis TaxID=374047 RepID=A0A7S2MM78_9STRA